MTCSSPLQNTNVCVLWELKKIRGKLQGKFGHTDMEPM